jgi:hypothetical protein
VASNDDRQELQRRFSGLTSQQRRAVVKAVNRGRAVETRKHAPLAVHIANRQMRFWKWSWVIGPAVGLLQIGQLGPAAAVLNALLATALLGSMSAFFYLRAQRSAQANLALMGGKRLGADFDRPAPRRVGGRGRRGEEDSTGGARRDNADADRGERTKRRWWGGRDTRPSPSSPPGGGGHLPSRPGGQRDPSERSDDDAPGTTPPPRSQTDLPPDRRPYQPRGKKRRGR